MYTSLVLGWVGSRVFKTDLASIFHFEQSNGALLCVSLEPFFIVKKIENWLWCTSFILKVFILMVFGIETSRLTDLIYDLYWAHLLWFLYIIPTIYLDAEHWRRCVAALTWLPGMSHWNFFKLLFTTCYYFFFFSWKLYLPDVWFANVEFVTHFTELKRLKWEKNSWDYYLVFEMSHLVISINSIINFKNIIIFCLI